MALPVVLHLINGLHAHFPKVPEIPLIYNIYTVFTEKPWHTLGWWPAMRFVIYFSVIGIASLLTLEVSFSLWFFYLFFKLQYIIMNAIGLSIGPWISCSRQVMGGYLVFVPAVFWIGREHIITVFRKTFGLGTRKDNRSYDLREATDRRFQRTCIVSDRTARISLWIRHVSRVFLGDRWHNNMGCRRDAALYFYHIYCPDVDGR